MRKLVFLLLLLLICLPIIGHAETLTFTSDLFKLHFNLPENWIQVDDPTQYVFLAPDESGAIVVSSTNTVVTEEMAQGFTTELVQEWIRSDSDSGLTNIEQLFFAKTVDATGSLYVLSSCGCMVGELPIIYTHYFFTATDGTLGGVSSFCINDKDDPVTLEWFDQMIVDNIPKEILSRLLEGGDV